MIGVWINCTTIVIGGILGTLLRGGIQERYRKTIHTGLALCVMLIGVGGAIKNLERDDRDRVDRDRRGSG